MMEASKEYLTTIKIEGPLFDVIAKAQQRRLAVYKEFKETALKTQ